jgi:hypothetical protein
MCCHAGRNWTQRGFSSNRQLTLVYDLSKTAAHDDSPITSSGLKSVKVGSSRVPGVLTKNLAESNSAQHDNTFRLAMSHGQEYLLQAGEEADMNQWVSFINWAAASKTLGIPTTTLTHLQEEVVLVVGVACGGIDAVPTEQSPEVSASGCPRPLRCCSFRLNGRLPLLVDASALS